MKLLLFYAGKLVENFDVVGLPKLPITDPELFNGGYIYWIDRNYRGWYRCDLTPVLDADVPAALKLLVLIMDP